MDRITFRVVHSQIIHNLHRSILPIGSLTPSSMPPIRNTILCRQVISRDQSLPRKGMIHYFESSVSGLEVTIAVWNGDWFTLTLVHLHVASLASASVCPALDCGVGCFWTGLWDDCWCCSECRGLHFVLVKR